MSLALDTNVLVRLLTNDDGAQCMAAVRVVTGAANEGVPVLLTMSVLLETEWVLRSRYKLPSAEIRRAFVAILETHELVVQFPSVLEEALMLWGDYAGSDFADCLHVAMAVQEERTLATFDQGAARLPGAALIPLNT